MQTASASPKPGLIAFYPSKTYDDHYRVSLTPVETALPTDTDSVSAKCVMEAGSPTRKREPLGE